MNNPYTNKAIDLVEAAQSELQRRNVKADANIIALIAQIQWMVETLKPITLTAASRPVTAPKERVGGYDGCTRLRVQSSSSEPVLTREDIDQIIEGIEHFIIGVEGDVDLEEIWQPYIDKLRASASRVGRPQPWTRADVATELEKPGYSLLRGWMREAGESGTQIVTGEILQLVHAASRVAPSQLDPAEAEAFVQGLDDVQHGRVRSLANIDADMAASRVGPPTEKDLRSLLVRCRLLAEECQNFDLVHEIQRMFQALPASAPRAQPPPFDPSNHHNALACPYCNPDNLTLSQQPPGESIKAVEQHRTRAQTPQDDLWQPDKDGK